MYKNQFRTTVGSACFTIQGRELAIAIERERRELCALIMICENTRKILMYKFWYSQAAKPGIRSS